MRDWPAGRGRSVLSLAPRICVLTAVLCAFSLALGARADGRRLTSSLYGSVTGATAQLSSLASGATGVTWVVRFVPRVPAPGGRLRHRDADCAAGHGLAYRRQLFGAGFVRCAGAGARGRRHSRRGHRKLHRTVEGEQRHRSRAQLEGVTNPPASGPQSLAVATSSDIDPATVTFALKGSGRNLGRVISPTVQLSSAAAGASQLNLEVTFTLPAGGSLAASTGEIFLVGPPGETFGDGGTIKDLTTGKSGGFNGVFGGVTVMGDGAVLAVSTSHSAQRRRSRPPHEFRGRQPGRPRIEDARDRDIGGSRLGGNRLHDRAGFQRHKCRRHVVVVVRRGGGERHSASAFEASATGGVVGGQGEITILAPPGEELRGFRHRQGPHDRKVWRIFRPYRGSHGGRRRNGAHASCRGSHSGRTTGWRSATWERRIREPLDMRCSGWTRARIRCEAQAPSTSRPDCSRIPYFEGVGHAGLAGRRHDLHGLVPHLAYRGPRRGPGTDRVDRAARARCSASNLTVTDVTTGSSHGSERVQRSLARTRRALADADGSEEHRSRQPNHAHDPVLHGDQGRLDRWHDRRDHFGHATGRGGVPDERKCVRHGGHRGRASCSTSAGGASGATCLLRFVVSASGAMRRPDRERHDHHTGGHEPVEFRHDHRPEDQREECRHFGGLSRNRPRRRERRHVRVSEPRSAPATP